MCREGFNAVELFPDHPDEMGLWPRGVLDFHAAYRMGGIAGARVVSDGANGINTAVDEFVASHSVAFEVSVSTAQHDKAAPAFLFGDRLNRRYSYRQAHAEEKYMNTRKAVSLTAPGYRFLPNHNYLSLEPKDNIAQFETRCVMRS